MPVVIKELVITATVDTQAAAAANEATSPAAEEARPLSRPQVQQLVQHCVGQVLAVLREQAEC